MLSNLALSSSGVLLNHIFVIERDTETKDGTFPGLLPGYATY